MLSMEYACLEGISTGIRQGLHPQPRYGENLAVPATADFLPYPKRTPHGISVCLLSQGLPDQRPGGIATYTVNLANGLKELGCSVHVISCGKDWITEQRDGIWFHSVAGLPVSDQLVEAEDFPTAARNLAYSYAVRQKLLDIESRWGLGIVESPNWDAEGLFAALDHRMPLIVRAHSPLHIVAETQRWEVTKDLQLCSALEGLLMRHADGVSGSTKALFSAINERFEVAGKGFLVPLGIDVEASRRPAPPVKGKMILFVGRLERRKGIHVLLDAIPRVLEESETAHFEIVGVDCGAEDGESWEHAWGKVAGKMRNRVRFRGEVSKEELAGLYEACDIFVAPSLYESFGLVYLEAMARGKAVIGCQTGGIPEVVTDGETGILVPPGDAATLSDAIALLLRDERLAARLGAAGLRAYSELFTTKAMAQRTLDLYQRVVDNWEASAQVVWSASAMDLQREPNASVLWHPQTENAFLLVEAGAKRTPVYGPYMRLEKGLYRAEFKLWVDAVPYLSEQFGSVDVFSMTVGTLGARDFGKGDVAAGPGCVLDVYFSVMDGSAGDYEFRLHTTGVVPLCLRQIVVSKYSSRPFSVASISLPEVQAIALDPHSV